MENGLQICFFFRQYERQRGALACVCASVSMYACMCSSFHAYVRVHARALVSSLLSSAPLLPPVSVKSAVVTAHHRCFLFVCEESFSAIHARARAHARTHTNTRARRKRSMRSVDFCRCCWGVLKLCFRSVCGCVCVCVCVCVCASVCVCGRTRAVASSSHTHTRAPSFHFIITRASTGVSVSE